jgi:hypothetical protein
MTDGGLWMADVGEDLTSTISNPLSEIPLVSFNRISVILKGFPQGERVP